MPKHIVAFVLPTGYSFNLDGSTLYLTLAAMFIAQAANIHVPFGDAAGDDADADADEQGAVAGVPRASLVVLAGTLASFNLPVEGIAVILGVDTLMDMARTSVNVLGNCLATAVVARWEGGGVAGSSGYGAGVGASGSWDLCEPAGWIDGGPGSFTVNLSGTHILHEPNLLRHCCYDVTGRVGHLSCIRVD